MPGCVVVKDGYPGFSAVCEKYKRSYPHIHEDVKEALAAIAADHRAAKNARRVKAGENVEVYKYRQNSRDIRRGATYGWRIIALYDKSTNKLYPLIVYPKTEMASASDAAIEENVRLMKDLLGYCPKEGCNGRLVIAENDATKLKCNRCGTWKSTEA